MNIYLETRIFSNRRHKALMLACAVWLATILVACGLGLWRGVAWQAFWPYAAASIVPAIVTLICKPVLGREWAQLLILLTWTSLAIAACVAVGFWPMATLFLCAPIAGAMLGKGKVAEAIALGVIFAATLYFAGHMGYLRAPIAAENLSIWTQSTALIAMILFMLMALLWSAEASDKSGASYAGMNSQYGAIFHAMPGGFITVDKKDNIIHIAGFGRALFDLPKEQNTKISLASIFATQPETSEKIQRFVADARGTQEGIERSLEYTDLTGSVKTLDLRAVNGAGGTIVLHGMDVSERAGVIDTLQGEKTSYQQNMEDKALFFSGVSHELRTPLNAIIGFSDMMRSRLFGPLPSKYAEYADLIHDSGQHMLDLIGDVLDISKVNAGKYELNYDTFDIADVIGSTVKMVRPAADAAEVRLDVDVSEKQDLLVEADRKAIRQILLNLLSNSIKFTPKGGQVFISAKIITGTLHLMVSDNGTGMDEEELQRIGRPFVQASSAQVTQQRGSGLGLSLVKSLTDLHGGRFAIASQKGTGTSVDIYIPLDRRADVIEQTADEA